MRTIQNKVLIIVLIAIALLLIVGGVFGYVYFCTDTFRSGQELFAKYLAQDIQEIGKIVTLEKADELEEKLKQNKYEETITISYSEEEAESNGLATIEIQNDPISKKVYGSLSLSTKNPEETLQVEYMKEADTYSLRFTNAVKQFLSFENNNLKQFATNLGASEEQLEQIPDKIEFKEISLDKAKFTEEEKNIEIEKYLELLYNNIAKEKYTKSKDAVITVNGKTITTNAYILTLNMQEIKNLTINLLQTLKQDEIVLSKLELIDKTIQEYSEESLKDSFIEAVQELIDDITAKKVDEEEKVIITVYEENGKTVRVKLEHALDFITLDTAEIDGKKQMDINFTSIDEQNTQLSNALTFIKENDNKLSIKLNTVYGEEQQSIKSIIELVENPNNIKLNINVEDESGQTLISRDISFVDEIDYKVTLDNTNNVIINNKTKEQLSTIFSLVLQQLDTEYVKQFKAEHFEPFTIVIKPISEILMYGSTLENITDGDLSESEKVLFNSQFTSYEGDRVSTEQVNELLDTAFLHNTEESVNEKANYVIVTGAIELDENSISITKVEGDKYFKVECKTDENGLVNKIVITEVLAQ